MIRKLCAVGLVCGPIPLIVGTFLDSSLFRYLMEKHKEKEIKLDKFFLEEKINLGIITNSKLKIIIDKIDSDFVYNDFEKNYFIVEIINDCVQWVRYTYPFLDDSIKYYIKNEEDKVER